MPILLYSALNYWQWDSASYVSQILLASGFLLNFAKKKSLMGGFKVGEKKNNSDSGSESTGSCSSSWWLYE